MPGYLSAFDGDLQLSSGGSSQPLCIIVLPSFVCCIFKLVTVDIESDIWQLCHFTQGWLKELLPLGNNSRLEHFVIFLQRSSFSAVKSSSLFVLFRQYSSLFHLDGIKAVMNKLQPLWRNQIIWRWHLGTGLHVITRNALLSLLFFFLSLFSFLCYTYNSIDLCCCKSLEISLYWFHFSGELFFLTHFFLEQARFSEKERKEIKPLHAECLRALGGGDCSHAVPERWKLFAFHRRQSDALGAIGQTFTSSDSLQGQLVRGPHLLCFFKQGTRHKIPTIVVDFGKSRRANWLPQKFFFFNVLYWFEDVQQTNTPVEGATDTSHAPLPPSAALISRWLLGLLHHSPFVLWDSWCYFPCLGAGWFAWTTLCPNWFPRQVQNWTKQIDKLAS